MRVDALRNCLKKSGLSIAEISRELGINPSTFYRKLSSQDGFSIGEVHKIVELLRLTDEEAISIFLT